MEYAKQNSSVQHEITDFKSISGFGVSGVINGKVCLAGKSELMESSGINTGSLRSTAEELSAHGKTIAFVSCGDRLAGVIAVADKIRSTSKTAFDQLNAAGIKQ